MIRESRCFSPVCDVCKSPFENYEGMQVHFDSPEEAVSEASGADWVQLSDGRLVCENDISDLVERGEIEEDEDGPDLYRLVVKAPEGAEQ